MDRKELFEQTLASIKGDIAMPPQRNMMLPVSYDHFYALIKAQAELIMRRQGKVSEYIIDANTEAVIRQIYGFTQTECDKGIALTGYYGCGKTLLMKSYCAVHNAICEQGNMAKHRYEVYSASMLSKKLKDITEFDRLVKVPLLIDELGREPTMVNNFGTQTTPLIDLIYEKWDAGVVTHITSNMTLQTLTEIYGDMTASRLYDMLVFIEMKGGDRRRK